MCLAVPGLLTEIIREDLIFKIGKVNFGGIIKDVRLDLVPEAKVGDYAIIHVGFAISLVSEEEAQQSMDLLREILEAEQDQESDLPQ